MNTPDITNHIEQLNNAFAFQHGNHRIRFEIGKGSIPVIKIDNDQASAIISLQGAHLLSWVPSGEDEVIWMSDDATFLPGKSVRGGIPICWPWFGPHHENASYPAHGFARTVLWRVTDVQPLSTGETQITFNLDTSELDLNLQQMWPQTTVAEYRLTIGKTLLLALTTFNTSNQSITLGQALHTYFSVDDVRNTSVMGLEGKDYLDKTDGFKRKTQTGPVKITTETDRVYLQAPDDLIIDAQERKITIKKQGSHSTVVWNPWEEVAAKMGDLGPDGHLKMLCVETANAAEDVVEIKPGESHTLRVTYEVEGT